MCRTTLRRSRHARTRVHACMNMLDGSNSRLYIYLTCARRSSRSGMHGLRAAQPSACARAGAGVVLANGKAVRPEIKGETGGEFMRCKLTRSSCSSHALLGLARGRERPLQSISVTSGVNTHHLSTTPLARLIQVNRYLSRMLNHS